MTAQMAPAARGPAGCFLAGLEGAPFTAGDPTPEVAPG